MFCGLGNPCSIHSRPGARRTIPPTGAPQNEAAETGRSDSTVTFGHIPGVRYKTKAASSPCPSSARGVLAACPSIGTAGYLFTLMPCR